MIVGPDFVWLHFPKTGGTSTEVFLKKTFRGQANVHVDGYESQRVIWHQSIEERLSEDPSFSIEGRRIICGFRRLPNWVVSRVCYEAQRPPFRTASREMLEVGRFFENNGDVNCADRYLEKYQNPRVDNWIRCEHIAEDIAAAFGLPVADVAGRLPFENQTAKISDVAFWFTGGDLERLYDCNPLWARLERELYGGLMQI